MLMRTSTHENSMPGLFDGLENPALFGDLFIDPSNLLPMSDHSEPLAITLRPQLRLRLLKSLFFFIPSTKYLSLYNHIVGLVRYNNNKDNNNIKNNNKNNNSNINTNNNITNNIKINIINININTDNNI